MQYTEAWSPGAEERGFLHYLNEIFSPEDFLHLVHSSVWANPFSAAWESQSCLSSSHFAIPKYLTHFLVSTGP